MARSNEKSAGRTRTSPPGRPEVYELACGTGRAVDVVGNDAVPVVECRAEGRGAENGDEAHERGKQRVLNEVLSLFIADKTSKEAIQIHVSHLPMGKRLQGRHSPGSWIPHRTPALRFLYGAPTWRQIK